MATTRRRTFIGQTAAAAAVWVVSPARVLGANDRVRIGVIGPGARGQELIKQVLKVPNAEVVAVADVYKRRHDESRALEPHAQAFVDHRRLLDLKDVDAVLVASPLHCHARHFLDTLAAGKDLYAEKTMTWSIAEAEACRSAAARSDRVVQIGLQRVSGGEFLDARRWVKEGLLGKVAHVQSWMSRNTPRGRGQWVRPVPADCTVENVNWELFLSGRPARPFDAHAFINWRLFWDYSGGNVTENVIHQFSWVMALLDLPVPAAAYMSGGVYSEKDGREVPDTIAITLDFPEQDLLVTWQSAFSNSRFGLGERVLGSHGTIEHVSGATDMVTGLRPAEAASAAQAGRLTPRVRYWPEKANRADGAALVGESQDLDHMANFIECVRSRKAPNAPVELGYKTAVAAHMANLSYRQKERVTRESIRTELPD